MLTDRGVNTKGVFMKEMSAAGVYIGTIATRAPYMLGKFERHGDMWKEIAAPVIEARNTTGICGMQLIAAEVSAILNERNRGGGFSPAQWVLARQPRYSAGEQARRRTCLSARKYGRARCSNDDFR